VHISNFALSQAAAQEPGWIGDLSGTHGGAYDPGRFTPFF